LPFVKVLATIVGLELGSKLLEGLKEGLRGVLEAKVNKSSFNFILMRRRMDLLCLTLAFRSIREILLT
jgi:hypothetical protein